MYQRGIRVKLTTTKVVLKCFILHYFQQDLFRIKWSVGSYKENIFQGEKRGRDTPLINTSGTETGPRFCHSVIVAGLERIEIQYFLRRKTNHLYKWLVLVFSIREGFAARALYFHCSMTPLAAGPPRDNDSVVGSGHSSFLVERCIQPFSDS